ncbi:endo-1,4-beta-xylanase A precursor [Andreesenia angusta]|uniref:Endo-1,4-beta-xylanase A n=1 Tax=Andreesenia angusta TaxID=39480 RepID=A0A1S1V5L2_9FIRM|nr:TraB/GumN family protein [Andreesenia angusta]OHW61903.1 endo-1,4-beta-xylanase A precursor [Andreesenia angusta]
MKFLKAKAMFLSAALVLTAAPIGSVYGAGEGIDQDVIESTVENAIDMSQGTKSKEATEDWAPPVIDNSPWAEKEVYDARVYGLVTYDLAKEVRGEISRADAAEAGVRLYERLTGDKIGGKLEDPFTDTDDRNVLKAYKLGIIKGVGKSKFNPDANVTRQDLAVIMYNSIWRSNPALAKGDMTSNFSDWGDVSGYAQPSMKYMLSNGIVKGKTETILDPKSNISKQETLIVAKRIYELMNESYDKTAKGLFYRVSDGKKDIYLLGSIHLGTENAYPISKKIRETFKDVENIAVEVNILEEAQLTDYIMSKATYPEGQSLKDDISPALYEEISKLLEEHKVLSIEDIEGYKPWYINMVLPMLVGLEDLEDTGIGEDIDYDNMTPEEIEELENLPYQYTPGIDKYFLEKAEQNSVDIVEIEGASYQIDMLSGMSKSTQEEILRTTVSQLVTGVDDQVTLDTMIAYWRAGDYASFESIIEMSMDSMPEEYNQALWHNRNREMANKVEEYLSDSDEDYFVVVGAGHLVGETSVVKELESKGYKVEAIR